MRLNRGLLGWGVFFVVLGAVPLAVRSGTLDAGAVRRAWELWPLVLVGIGLGLVLERTRLAILGGLVVALTFGLMGGAVLAGATGSPIGFTSCGFGGEGDGEPFAEQRGAFDAGEAEARFELDCGTLTVGPSDGPGWTVTGESDDGLPPAIQAAGDRLFVRAPERRGIGVGARGSHWDVALPRATSLAVSLSVNAGEADLRLDGMAVREVDVSVNAGDASIDLGTALGTRVVEGSANAGSLSVTLPRPEGMIGGNLSVNAGSLELCVPGGVPVRLRMDDSALGSNNFEDQGLTRQGDTWSTPAFTATDAVDLSLSANLGSITLNPEDGCGD